MIRSLGEMGLKARFIIVITAIVISISIAENFLNYRMDVRFHRENLISRALTIAHILGDNATAAVQFKNASDAQELLKSFVREPSIREAYLFDSSGDLLAQYVGEGETSVVPKISLGEERVQALDEGIVVLHPVTLNEKVIGALYIRADFIKLRERKKARISFGLQSLLAALGLSILLGYWGQRYFLAPITSLANLAETIGKEQQFSTRVKGDFKGELGVLANNFNFMLSELETSEAELKKRTEQLQASNEQLEQFANIAAHDLQEPLRKARSYAARLVSKCKDELSESGKEYLERMDRSVERMQKLVDDLLEFSRVKTRAKPFARTDLKEVVTTVVSDLQIRISEVAGRVEIGDLPVIDADGVQMQQLLQNLIANGLKFHQKEKKPVVSISSRNIRERIPDSSTSESFCEIIVSDNGIGFEEKYLERIFQPFQRLHGRDEYPGTGMGLAICRRIVERHRGTITARSEAEKGATFIITLPVRQNHEHESADDKSTQGYH